MTDHRRSSWLLLTLVVLAVLTVPAAAWAQGAPAKTTATGCEFNKRQAIEANGGPLGKAIWGRLCQVIDGKPTMAEGARLTASQDGEQVAAVTTGPDGVFVLPIPGNGTFAVVLDPATLPKGFSLTSAKESTLGQVSVQLGDQQATFRLGADTRGTRTFSDYATTAVKGLRIGLVLAVAAVGLSLVYGVTGLVNFAHAELVTLGAITAYVATKAGIPFWLALPVAAAVGAGLGWGNEVLLWRPLRKRRMGLLSMMVVSIGLGIAVRNMLQVLFGPDGRRYQAATGQVDRAYGPLRLTTNDLLIMLTCTLVLLAMTYLLRRTRIGTAIRAVADNPDLAASSGIAVDRIISIVWMLAGALAAIGGVLYALTLNVKFDMGSIILLFLFASVVLGGLGNAYGAVLGAILLGVVQETSGLLIDTAYKYVVALLVLIIVLLIRPQGILGQPERFG